MPDPTAPLDDALNDTLTQVDFTHEELSVLLRLVGAGLPLFTPLELDETARDATLRALYARGVITADADGQFSVDGGAAVLVTAGVTARGIAQLDRPSQQVRDLLYVMNGFVIRQTEPLPGVQRFQILDTPYKLVALLTAALNITPGQTTAPAGQAVTLPRAKWQALHGSTEAVEGVPESLWQAVVSPNVVVGLTLVTVEGGQPQAPKDVLLIGHSSGGYWKISFSGDRVMAEPLDSVGAVQVLVGLLGEVPPGR